MARTTVDNVEAIIDIDSGISLTPFIEAANALVTQCCSTATDADGDLVYTATNLELIERWLSAHFYHIRDPKAKVEKAGSVSAEYRTAVKIGFDNTHYGQMAMRLDWNGGLAALNDQVNKGTRGQSVGIYYLGTEPTTYTDDT